MLNYFLCGLFDMIQLLRRAFWCEIVKNVEFLVLNDEVYLFIIFLSATKLSIFIEIIWLG